MAVTLLVVMGLLAFAAVAAWVLAIGVSRRIEPRPRSLAAIFRTAFWRQPDDTTDPVQRARLRHRVVAAFACLIAMAMLSFALPVIPPSGVTTADAAPAPTPDPTGTTLAYIRSNQNGTKPERIFMHVVSPTEVHVAKMVAPCTDAAYVIGIFDPKTREASRLIGGRLNREGKQDPQLYLDLVPATRTLELHIGDPAAKPAEVHPAPAAPWRMYDFDLAEFALFGPHETRDFSFGLAMAWPDGASPVLRMLGKANAHFLYSSDKGARNHFRISGPAFSDPTIGDRGGEMITDATTGRVIEAHFGRPNHTEYDNFQIKLTEATPAPAGEAAWRQALADHWTNCPAE